MPHFGLSSTFKGHLLLGRDRVPRETSGFVAPPDLPTGDTFLPQMTFVPLYIGQNRAQRHLTGKSSAV